MRSLACPGEGEGVERSSVTDDCKARCSSVAQLSQLLTRVSSGKWCFGSSHLQGILVGSACPVAMNLREWHLHL